MNATDLLEAIESIRRIPIWNPFPDLARQYGFDLYRGDWIIVPEALFVDAPILERYRHEEGVKTHTFDNNVYFIKTAFPKPVIRSLVCYEDVIPGVRLDKKQFNYIS